MKSRAMTRIMQVFLCVVVVVSAFFYAPMEVFASGLIDGNCSADTRLNIKNTNTNYVQFLFSDVDLITSSYDLDKYYRVDLDFEFDIAFDRYAGIRHLEVLYGSNCLHVQSWADGFDSINPYYHVSTYVVLQGYDLIDKNLEVYFRVMNDTDNPINISFSLDYLVAGITPLSNSDSSSFQQGYDEGYADGESAGYSNGYSQGYLEGEENGFQAGQDSVNTDSYYNLGYNAGYSSGYTTGYDEGYSSALKSVQTSDGVWGSYMFLGSMKKVKRAGVPFYVSSNGLIDMEEYQSGANGYFYNTQPGTYDGYSTVSYHIPFYDFSNGLTQIDSNKFNVKFEVLGINPYLSSDLGGGDSVANLMRSRVEEVYVVYNGKKYYGNYDIGTSYAEFDFFVENVASPTFLGNGSMTLYFVLHNSVTLVTDSHGSIYISGQYLPNLEFELGRDTAGYAVAIRPYISNDRVSANIQNQTDQLTNGYDSSQGAAMNEDFKASVNDYQTAEDSLFTSAQTSLDNFTFLDFTSITGMVTALSFVSSIMTSIYNAMGGDTGASGIVLSVLFSIMLVSMAIGLYRFYVSNGKSGDSNKGGD